MELAAESIFSPLIRGAARLVKEQVTKKKNAPIIVNVHH